MRLPDGKGSNRSPSIMWAGLLCGGGVFADRRHIEQDGPDV
jgi:hypothetical protein